MTNSDDLPENSVYPFFKHLSLRLIVIILYFLKPPYVIRFNILVRDQIHCFLNDSLLTFTLIMYYLQLFCSFKDMKSLSEFFPKCLENASGEMRVVLILDSLDQLSPEDGGRQLDWWPRCLPDNVFVILSTLPGEEFEAFPNLKVSSLLMSTQSALKGVEWGVGRRCFYKHWEVLNFLVLENLFKFQFL